MQREGAVHIRDTSNAFRLSTELGDWAPVSLQGQFVYAFAHIYEPVRDVHQTSQTGGGPYSTPHHACLATYFVDGTPPDKGVVACPASSPGRP